MTFVLLLETELFSGEMPSPLCSALRAAALPSPGREKPREAGLQLLRSAESCLLLAGSASGEARKLDEFQTSP